MHCGSPGKLACYRRGLVGSQRPPVPCPVSHVAALPGPRPVATSTILHQTSTILHETSTNALDFCLMSDQLPRLGGLSEPEKYDRLVERVPGVWWSDEGPLAGLHGRNAGR